MQLLVNGLIAGSIYMLVASGFSLIYSVNKFQNFAIGSMVAFAGYMTYLFYSKLAIGHFLLVIPLVIVATIILGLALDFVVFRQLRRRNASYTVMMIASLALLTLLSSLLLIAFSSDVKIIKANNVSHEILGARMTDIQLFIIAASILVIAFLYWISFRTKIGKAMRALADNKDVAQIVGIDPEKVYMVTAILASLLAGVAGILIGMENNLYPQMGLMLIVKGFAASIMGGVGLLHGTVLGSYLLGFAENFGIWYIPSGYKDAISFMLLFVFLLFRPYGLLGRKKREDVS